MKKIGLFVVFFVLAVLPSFLTLAQNTGACPVIVQTALRTVDELCGETGRNQACYGNLTLSAEPQPDVSDLQFDSPGDVTDIIDIRSLVLSPINEASREWGVSLMRLQANLPDTLPGQNVTILLFGDVSINPAQALPEIMVTVRAGSSVNVRGGPSTGDSIVGALAAGAEVMANGRSESGDWLRVRLPEGGTGWVYAELVSGEGFSALDVVTVDDVVFTPTQAFYFRSGIADAPCAEAPDSGILIQTPQGVGEIRLTVNDVSITLGSTAYLQAQPGGLMTMYVVEGQGTISAFDETEIIPAGSKATVPLNDDLRASGPPNATEPYDEDDVQALPIEALPDDLTVAAPLNEDEITAVIADRNACTVTAPGPVNLRSGPGTVYPTAGGMDSEKSAKPTGQAEGVDGFVWYQLSDGGWVRSDVVQATGSCDALPEVADIPPTPIPPSNVETNQGSANSNRYPVTFYYNGQCPYIDIQISGPETASASITTGQEVTLQLPAGSYQCRFTSWIEGVDILTCNFSLPSGGHRICVCGDASANCS